MLRKESKRIYIISSLIFLFFLASNPIYALEKDFGYNFSDKSTQTDDTNKEAELRFYKKSSASKTSVGSSLFFLNNEKTANALKEAEKVLKKTQERPEPVPAKKTTVQKPKPEIKKEPKVFLPPLSKVINPEELVKTDKIEIEKIEPVPEYKTSISEKILESGNDNKILINPIKQKEIQDKKAKKAFSKFRIFKKYFLIFIIAFLIAAAGYLIKLYWQNRLKEEESISKDEYFNMKKTAENFYADLFKKKSGHVSNDVEIEQLIKDNYNISDDPLKNPVEEKKHTEIKNPEETEDEEEIEDTSDILQSGYFKQKLQSLENNIKNENIKVSEVNLETDQNLDKMHKKIIKLAKKGYSSTQISSILKMSAPEVELTLSLASQKIS